MKLIIDMNLSPRWVSFLASAEIESMHWSLLGAANAPDAAIMRFAHENDYVVLTHDLDFSAILAATSGEKPSVAQIRSEDVNPDSIGANVVIARKQMTQELELGALVTVDTSRTRVRVLPLRVRED